MRTEKGCEDFFCFRVGMKYLVQLNTFGRTRCAKALTPLNRKKGTVRLERAVHSKQKIRHANSTVNSTVSSLETLYAYKRNLSTRTRKPGRCSESKGLRRSDHERLAAHLWLAPCVYVLNDLGMKLCVLDEAVTDKPNGYHFRLNEKEIS